MQEPLFIRVHPRDNVAIVVRPEGAKVHEHIPQSHKVSLEDLSAGAPIIRYGQVIGYANRDIVSGSWVREDLMLLPEPPGLDGLRLATDVPRALPAVDNVTFDGYRNLDGSTGTKNILGITTTVQCVAPTVDHAVRRIKSEVLPRYSNVDDVVAITHSYGCGVAIDAPGAAVPIQTIRHISLHPNVGAAPLIISLGCEKLQP
ncbi:MAG TPA: UxaA family hydrolase [Bryobacteraceae bacterium]|nr:UxaA family hydrolase [Bryobacteraceae bacterium]